MCAGKGRTGSTVIKKPRILDEQKRWKKSRTNNEQGASDKSDDDDDFSTKQIGEESFHFRYVLCGTVTGNKTEDEEQYRLRSVSYNIGNLLYLGVAERFSRRKVTNPIKLETG